ncbi:hypothetical protein J4T85_035320 (plasmid) [Sinorhizobium medicae]|nr:hypothetical protein [Sinorhizobium medicae]MBO1965539.1 hypothetical protein [Sinorhizobium medicae]
MSDLSKPRYVGWPTRLQYISPTNLNGTVKLFKDLGRAKQAKEILDYYMANRRRTRLATTSMMRMSVRRLTRELLRWKKRGISQPL